ncbi:MULTISPECIES: hypothetical protein [Lysinibacillus]|uniref:hypothetical protein n=1 Tax=Lysinibacillus TaxID=400634 RepID=UPI00214B63AB|nr:MULTISPECIES: hypothetical protein [Lysinibacillus]UUV25998.1 hypothetical protein NP781_05095 [Lysinibacillus sp. FN11]UYB48870.1 hypothetical protein OCI51_07880 [Lysinibacillus capsici]
MKKLNTEKNNKEYSSCIIPNEEIDKIFHDALLKYLKSLPVERLLEIESYMSCD